MYPWWGKQFRTKRSLPFLVSCLIGLKSSSLLISSFALDHRGISTTMFKIVLLSSAKRGMSCQEETGFPAWFSSQTRQSTIQVKEEWGEPRALAFWILLRSTHQEYWLHQLVLSWIHSLLIARYDELVVIDDAQRTYNCKKKEERKEWSQRIESKILPGVARRTFHTWSFAWSLA